jgi:hypothetical protein
LVVPGDAKSVVITDLNGDDWPDLVVGVNDGDVAAFENQGIPGGRMAVIQLQSGSGNPSGIGSRVTLVRSDGIRQTAEVQAGGGHLSQQPDRLWFGLGPRAEAASIEVRWPDGTTSRRSIRPDEVPILIKQPG